MIKIDEILIKRISQISQQSGRKRKNYNFHKHLSDPLQRLLNAMEPETYVQPHKHENPDKREVFIILSGSAAVIEFDETGNITGKIILNHKTRNYGVEIDPGVYHSIISLEKGTVVYEIKDGPYSPTNDKFFAIWAPEEGDPGAQKYLNDLKKKIGL